MKINYWDLAGEERLFYNDIDEAVEGILAQSKEKGEKLPKIIRLTGFVYMRPDVKSTAKHILNDLLYSWDCEFRDEATEPTESMKNAAEKFIKAILKDYEFYNCEPVCTKDINVKKWLKRNSDNKRLKELINYAI